MVSVDCNEINSCDLDKCHVSCCHSCKFPKELMMMNGSTKYGIPAIAAGVAICLVCACCSAALLYQYGDALLGMAPGTGTNPSSGPVIVPADTSNLPEWTVIVYSDADDDILEEDLLLDINEMELVGFVSWAVQNYPAKKYALILSDHGGGWTGGFSDLNSDSALTFTQIVDSISEVQGGMGGQKFEIIGFDACLMGMIEVYGSLYP